MKVKIFQAFGKNEIDNLEKEINDWFRSHEDGSFELIDTTVTAAGVGDESETYQTLIVCIWYEGLVP